MDATLAPFQQAIANVFPEWDKLPATGSTFRIVGVLDNPRNRYLLEHVEQGGRSRSLGHLPIFAYLEICQDKIWVQVDNTEVGIATQLVAAGIRKDQIVLGFYSPAMRQLGEFALA